MSASKKENNLVFNHNWNQRVVRQDLDGVSSSHLPKAHLFFLSCTTFMPSLPLIRDIFPTSSTFM